MTAEEFRAMALALPEAEERETWGEATFRVRDKIFAMLASATVSVKASREEQAALIAADPETFQVAPYTGRFGWVLVRLASVDPGEMRELVVEAWRRTAPRQLVAAYDAER
ncbi:MmcQ/YjbR family DNA-binding protein [Carbonactinospora thermoautotrophica]|uniref:MmcQ/YjbR family DNA-binding protein n=1 Tax=Carbonactinospora thermoautotrophica TaxID=1469144 RepID=UPI00226D72E9|nr:MmcQ/YjbR family DNA-binding protein [Carbonactinospora thermoautotrophica]